MALSRLIYVDHGSFVSHLCRPWHFLVSSMSTMALSRLIYVDHGSFSSHLCRLWLFLVPSMSTMAPSLLIFVDYGSFLSHLCRWWLFLVFIFVDDGAFSFFFVLTMLVISAWSPVNHKGLYQGWKQTSIHFLHIPYKSHQTHNSSKIHNISLDLNINQNIQIWKTNVRRNNRSVPPLFKKARKARTCLYHGFSSDLSNQAHTRTKRERTETI